jgi:arylsulfatase A-like enzyme
MINLSRFLFSQSLIVIICTFLLTLTACKPDQNTNEDQKPNIILIFTDELQFSDIGAYGGNIPTPEIDALARQGIKFTKAYTTASMCTPSRFSVLTGLYPGRCHAETFLQANPTNQPYNIAWNTWITPELKTLPRMLSENGYVTGISGKWHLSHLPESVRLPDLQSDEDLDDPGVEEKLRIRQKAYEKQVKIDAGFDYASSIIWQNFDNHPIQSLRFHNFPWITKGAIQFLEDQATAAKPFFLYLTPTAIHGPNHVEDLEKDKTYTLEGKQADVSQYNIDEQKLKQEIDGIPGNVSHRYAGISNIDHQLKLIRQKLREIGKEDNTIIIFMSDHNIEPGKATSYEKGIHIPMIVYWPGKTHGKQSSALISSIDIFPTLLQMAGVPVNDLKTDGKSFLHILNNPNSKGRAYVFSENGYTRSISNGRYKYIALRYPENLIFAMQDNRIDHAPSYVGRWPQAHSAIAIHGFPNYFDQNQLYDLKNDPYEQNNIYSEQTEIAITLKKELQKHLSKFQHPFDLADIDYLESEDYHSKCRVNKAWDLANIPWLKRDHGVFHWPPK